MYVRTYCLQAAKIQNSDIFRVPEGRLEIFASDRFCQKITQLNIAGLDFTEVDTK